MTAPALTAVKGRVPRFVDRNHVTWIDDRGRDMTAPVSDIGDVAFEEVPPVRPMRWHPNQRNFPTLFFFDTTKQHIRCESRLERNHLMLLDFDPHVTAVSAQPFELWMPGTDRRTVRAYPDFFVRRVDGSAAVIDVKNDAQHAAFEESDKCALTRAACDEAGWGYRVVAEPPSQRLKNVQWLAGYRRTPIRFGEHRQPLLDACQEPTPVCEVLAAVGEPVVVLPALMHLCWHSDVVFDLDRPLRSYTEVWAS